jgi:AcrR family transcriptional regulator
MPRDAAATRDRLLEHARRMFAQHGYAAITVKGVADAAGVSPNLVTRYFGGKEGLLLAASRMEVPIVDSFDGDLAGLGGRVAASIVERWAGPSGTDPLLVLLRAAGERPEAAAALSEFLETHADAPLQRHLRACGFTEAEARRRAEAVDSFVLGVAVRRRMLRPDLGDVDEFRSWLGSTIQRIVDGGA